MAGLSLFCLDFGKGAFLQLGDNYFKCNQIHKHLDSLTMAVAVGYLDNLI